MWHRRESDESGESAPEEGGEGARAPQPIPRSASYPCATPRPGAPETTALHGAFQRRYGGITGIQPGIPERRGFREGWFFQRRKRPSGWGPRRPTLQVVLRAFPLCLVFFLFLSLDPGTVPRAPSHFSRLPLGGWAEDGQPASRHPEPVPEEGSEDELPPQVHKVKAERPGATASSGDSSEHSLLSPSLPSCCLLSGYTFLGLERWLSG